MKDSSIRQFSLVPCTVCFVAGAGFVAALTWPAWGVVPEWMKEPTWPAWIQAVGSVAGIFAAVAVAWQQQRFTQRQSDARDLRDLTALHVRANRILGRFLEVIDQQIAEANAIIKSKKAESLRAGFVPKEVRDLEGEIHLLGALPAQHSPPSRRLRKPKKI
ncbi:hypothetical protein [Xanthomonas translucens]|uniref:hypothetical protein n=1 Tax=Xanthomonas campestris pv. translucens TaxID=343 RepID=UPI00200B78E3|nr:hypothetical protein [Xanthomonas translucens]UPU47778.1 hypothetical protein MZO50_13550 [Xanthomonas translucens pv. undulosa]